RWPRGAAVHRISLVVAPRSWRVLRMARPRLLGATQVGAVPRSHGSGIRRAPEPLVLRPRGVLRAAERSCLLPAKEVRMPEPSGGKHEWHVVDIDGGPRQE